MKGILGLVVTLFFVELPVSLAGWRLPLVHPGRKNKNQRVVVARPNRRTPSVQQQNKSSVLAGSCLLFVVMNSVSDVPVPIKLGTVPVFVALSKIAFPTLAMANPAMDVILSSIMRSSSIPWPFKIGWSGGYLLLGNIRHRWGTAIVLACLIGQPPTAMPMWQAKVVLHWTYSILSILKMGCLASFPAFALAAFMLTRVGDVPYAYRIGSALAHIALGLLSILHSSRLA